MSLNKDVVKDLKDNVRKLSFTNITKNDIIRKLKSIYYENILNKDISYDTYMEVTTYLVLFKALNTTYQIR